ncbi:hypothetical protein PP175_04960 [Aneurinibacillus sp. Ricciae_BoGa-3]|uniref:hypothetical protein n=1 Tax=Aneurinibacillus sp. Ricciae_BoGa-3 TaxID=3022697 RepID=UPI00234208A1|nr:hypothetical protein [Aneurinibacillus sp. Ricciae_BoGa-3]WCK55327.1 hypothetical protein PP175_04960 [Aneurinibacillus sp. Ricciae_BoGa-3]
MFDPTIFENLKIALEGTVYDKDFSGEILVTSRHDAVDLADMSREYRIGFQLKENNTESPQQLAAEIVLKAETQDLSGEILEMDAKDSGKPGCTIFVYIYHKAVTIHLCSEIEDVLDELWSFRPRIRQELSFALPLDKKEERYKNTITLDFGRKIDESNFEDLPEMIDCTISSLESITNLMNNRL